MTFRPRSGLKLAMFVCLGVVVTATLTATEIASANDADSSSLATTLRLVKDAADSLCGNVVQSGSKTKEQIRGEVKVALSGLAKHFSDAGLSVNGGVENEQFVGVLQDQLSATLRDTQQCKLGVAILIFDKQSGPAAVINPEDCPYGYTKIYGNTFTGNGIVVQAPADAKLCFIRNDLINNIKGLDLTAPQK